jgi:tetratricopeptide (TPR) repeat protein
MTSTESLTERVERCRQQIEEQPESAVAHYNLGLAYQKWGKFRLAEEAYVAAVERDPDLVEAWVNLGGVRLHLWDFDGCLAASKEAVRRRDDLVLAHYNLGQAYLYKNEPEQLVECTRRVLELDRNHAEGHYFAAVGLLATGDLSGAERHLGRSVELGHQPPPEFLRAMDAARQKIVRRHKNVIEIAGAQTPDEPKED